LHQFTENDLRIIKNDWKPIIDKIKAGKAHEISEGDTYYLGACTKGANSETLRQQPFSPIMAKQRAFSLKTTYMTQIVRELTSNTKKEDSLFDYIDLIEDSIEDSILKKMSPYFGMSERELLGLFGIESKAKNKFELITNKILGIKRNLSSTPEFKKANIKVKTIRVNSNDKIKESMSFPAFKYEELVKETWEESPIRLMFETTKFLFIVFREMNGEFYFDDVIFWNMPITHIETNVKKVWEKTVDVVKRGNIVSGYKKNGDRKTNFPSTKFDKVCHVRPHGINKKDVYPLPIQDQYTGSTVYTKHCFWLNNTYVLSIVNRPKVNSDINN
jgi:DNA mismatch repair protein MutH